MSRTTRGMAVQLLGTLGLLLLVLTGCNGSSGDSSSSAPGVSRLTLQMVTTDQARNRLRRATSPAQTRQADIAEVRVDVTAADISPPITVLCQIPGPSADARCQSVTETEEAIILVVELSVPRGTDRLITVSVFDDEDVERFYGETTRDLTQDNVPVAITLSPIATPADLENRRFGFRDGAAFGLVGESVELEFGSFGETDTGPVILDVPTVETTAAGTATAPPLVLRFDESDIPELPSGTVLSFRATVNDDGSINLTNIETGAISISTPPMLVLPVTTVVGRVEDQEGMGIEGATVSTNGEVTGVTASDGSFSLPNVPTDMGDIVVDATFTTEGGLTFTGSSASFPPVIDGETDVGTIVISLVQDVTTVVGRVEDQEGVGIAGAAVTTNGGVTGFTVADGSFSLPNVPTDMGDIAASAAFTTDAGLTFTGSSPSFPPVVGGETDVGTIVIVLVQEDTVVLASDPFQIPAGIDRLAFEFNFVSNEFPEFVGDIFDDTSFALVRADSDTVETRVLATVNTSNFIPSVGSGFDGQTGFLPASFDVSSLAGSDTPVVLVISVRDVGDNFLDSAILLDTIRLVDDDTGMEQLIPNGDFETGNFDEYTVTFVDQNTPSAGVITGLGPNNNDSTVIGPPQGSFMGFLATGTEALGFIASPPSVLVFPDDTESNGEAN